MIFCEASNPSVSIDLIFERFASKISTMKLSGVPLDRR